MPCWRDSRTLAARLARDPIGTAVHASLALMGRSDRRLARGHRMIATMTETTEPAIDKDFVAWSDLDELVLAMAERLEGMTFDVMLAITRGGLVPAGMLAYRLRLRNILVAAVEYYDDHGLPGPHPTFLQFPADPLLRGQRVLIVDEVWDSGTTIAAVTDRVRQAGGIPTTAVLHYKPTHSVVDGEPDVFAVQTDRWVVYPFKAGG